MTEERGVLYPIGHVEKQDGQTRLRVYRKYVPGLLGLHSFSHVHVFWWFGENDTPRKRETLQVHPRGDEENPLTGVFATRAPVRPNLIATTLCRIRGIDDDVVRIDDIEAFDGTPILDLKPYIPALDCPKGDVRVPQWV
ncbi:MAG: tRNA (N6-threonylcarbamoyladenosine(37)-N6)-methyltransferase TrmO [Sedimentisphaerales bacterium]|nr:tRNA (N6-threonylcarbamoyladenosine(37)-N6)-methyltransferase TrmO [Sedimentisphaerales bacterium]